MGLLETGGGRKEWRGEMHEAVEGKDGRGGKETE